MTTEAAITVDKLISELQKLSEQGKGDAIVIAIPSQAPVTGVSGSVPVSNADHDAVMLYAKNI